MTSPRTLTAQLIDAHLLSGRREPGRELGLRVDQVLIEDATGTMTALQFEALGGQRSAVPLAVLYVDHNVLQLDERNMDDHRYLRSFCSRYGVHYSKPGNGISHYVHLERFAAPGQLLIGADSHTSSAGAAGMLAIGTGGLEVAVSMAGHPFELTSPTVVGVELRGRLPEWVQPKDVILEILRRRDVRGGVGRVFEFHGDGVASLSIPARATIANMIVELGATTAVFPSDAQTQQWLAAQRRARQFIPLAAEPGCMYDETELIDLGSLEPLVALPSSPGNVTTVSDVEGTELVQVCVGSSVNSAYIDLAIVAATVDGSTVHPRIDLTVTPGSRQILDTIVRSGVYGQLLGAGARILEPICGPCIGVGQAPSAGKPSLRTFNRNFPGRSGTENDRIYLCSPATAAASALTGRITDPRSLGPPPGMLPAPDQLPIDDRAILAPAPPDEAAGIDVTRGPNIVAPPPGRPPEDTLAGEILIVVADNISTGDMAPDGAIGMSVWSDITRCATFMFRRLDRNFHKRAVEAGGGLIVGGHNYGQGSSREHAALSAVQLGIRAVLAKSFARIHRRNLLLNAVLPLTFGDEHDYDRLLQGEHLEIADVRTTIQSGGQELVAMPTDGSPLPLRIDLLPREREILLAGGLLRLLSRQAVGAGPSAGVRAGCEEKAD
jgi:aconitate hydratase